MTYRIEQWVRKITSPVMVRIGDENIKMADGKQLAERSFDRPYLISEVSALDDMILIVLVENDKTNDITWVGEEQASFF